MADGAVLVLRSVFKEVCSQNAVVSPNVVSVLWTEIERAYRLPERRYHTLEHLFAMHAWILRIREHLQDPAAATWALFYHDFVYDVRRSDNEEKSADHAEKVLNMLQSSDQLVSRVRTLILSTKTHDASDDDCKYFIDCDLSILGADDETYARYRKAVRLEFIHVPELEFRDGRRRVLQRFLSRTEIFTTPYMRDRLEETARRNIALEIDQLGR